MTSGGDDDLPVFDEEFVRAAAIREEDLRRGAAAPPPPAAKPSKESLREVRREAKQRRSGPAAVAGDPYAPREGGPLRRVLTFVVVAGVAVAAVWGFLHLPKPRRVSEQQPSVVPSYTPEPTRPPAGDPFAGTRVESWATGAQGVKAPAVGASAGFSSAQVAAAYAATGKFVRVAMLDRRVLYEGSVAPVVAAIQPASASHFGKNMAHLATRFRPELEPASPVVKVNGYMRLGKPPHDAALSVDFSYVAVYALRPAGETGAAPVLVTVRRHGTLEFGRAGRTGVSKPWVRRSSYASSHEVCGVKWPHTGYTPVVLDGGASAAPEPTATANLLDPEEKPPAGVCYENTGELG